MADFPFEGTLVPAQAGEKIIKTGDAEETNDKLFVSQAQKDIIDNLDSGPIIRWIETGFPSAISGEADLPGIYCAIIEVQDRSDFGTVSLRIGTVDFPETVTISDGTNELKYSISTQQAGQIALAGQNPIEFELVPVSGTPKQFKGLVLADVQFPNVIRELDDLSDVDITNPQAGNGIVYNGTSWENGTINTGVEIATGTTETPVTATRINYPGSTLTDRGSGEYDVNISGGGGNNTIIVSNEAGGLSFTASRLNFQYSGLDEVTTGEYTVTPTLRVRNDETTVLDGVAFINFPDDSLLEASTTAAQDWVDIKFTGTQGILVANQPDDTGAFVYQVSRLNFPDAQVINQDTGVYNILTGNTLIEGGETYTNKRILNFTDTYIDVEDNSLNDKAADLTFQGIDVSNGGNVTIRSPKVIFPFNFDITGNFADGVTVEWRGVSIEDGASFDNNSDILIFPNTDFVVTGTQGSGITIASQGLTVNGSGQATQVKTLNFEPTQFDVLDQSNNNAKITLSDNKLSNRYVKQGQYLAYVREGYNINLLDPAGNESALVDFSEEVVQSASFVRDVPTREIKTPDALGVHFVSFVLTNSIPIIANINPGQTDVDLKFSLEYASGGPVVDINGNNIETTRTVNNGNTFQSVEVSGYIFQANAGSAYIIKITADKPCSFKLDNRIDGPSGVVFVVMGNQAATSMAMLQYSQDTRRSYILNEQGLGDNILGTNQWFTSDQGGTYVDFGPDSLIASADAYSIYSGDQSVQYGYFGNLDPKQTGFKNAEPAQNSLPYWAQVMDSETTALLKSGSISPGNALNANGNITITTGKAVLLTAKYTGDDADSYFGSPEKLITGVEDSGGGNYVYVFAPDWELVDQREWVTTEEAGFVTTVPSDAVNYALIFVPGIDTSTGVFNPYEITFSDLNLSLTGSQVFYTFEIIPYAGISTDQQIILNSLTLNDDGSVEASTNWTFPSSTINLGDSSLSSGANTIIAKSDSVVSQQALLGQQYDESNFSPVEINNPFVGATYLPLQIGDDTAFVGPKELKIKIKAIDSFVQKINIKPGTTITESFDIEFRLSDTGQTIYIQTFQPEDMIDIGGGEFELIMNHPVELRLNDVVFIRYKNIPLLGGEGFDDFETDGIEGDPIDNYFFPYSRLYIIPVVKQPIATEEYADQSSDLSSKSVTELSDVISAGSGEIITAAERTKLDNIADKEQYSFDDEVTFTVGSDQDEAIFINYTIYSSGTDRLNAGRLVIMNKAGELDHENEIYTMGRRVWASYTPSIVGNLLQLQINVLNNGTHTFKFIKQNI